MTKNTRSDETVALHSYMQDQADVILLLGAHERGIADNNV